MQWINRLLLLGIVLWIESMEVSFFESNSDLGGRFKVNLPAAWAEEMTPGEVANRDFKDQIDKNSLLQVLKQGGYVIYIRHAQTEKDYADQVTAEMGDCSTQRMLSEVGWQQARAIGQGFQKYGIPYDQVFASQYCRAWQTADLAFGKYVKNGDLNFPKAEDYSPEQVAQMKALLTPLLTQIPAPGTNTIIVGHDDLFEATTGIYPDPQGMAYIIKTSGNGQFTLVANLEAEEWLDLDR